MRSLLFTYRLNWVIWASLESWDESDVPSFRNIIWNSSISCPKLSTLPLDHGGSLQYLIVILMWTGEKHFVSLKPEYPELCRDTQSALTSAAGQNDPIGTTVHKNTSTKAIPADTRRRINVGLPFNSTSCDCWNPSNKDVWQTVFAWTFSLSQISLAIATDQCATPWARWEAPSQDQPYLESEIKRAFSPAMAQI